MTDSPLPSLLITPDARRRLQQRYEEARRIRRQTPRDYRQVHQLLAECLRADPGNILYLESLLANLREWQPASWRTWLPRWLRTAQPPLAEASENQALARLREAPERLLAHHRDSAVLGELAAAAGQCQLEEIEVVYWREAVRWAPDDVQSLAGLARALSWCGRFDDALAVWRQIPEPARDNEAAQAIEDLARGPLSAEAADPPSLEQVNPADLESALEAARRLALAGNFEAAEQLLGQAQSAAGGNLRVHEARESLQLARSDHRLTIARRRTASDPHPRAAALVGRIEQEHNRLEIDIFHVQSERHSDDFSLRLELARRLQKAGNYSGAIQRLEEVRASPALAPAATLLLGECWQRLRQFARALDLYSDAGEMAEVQTPMDDTTLAAALYRRGVLAAAMNLPAEAREAFRRLLAIDPAYKDARQRLDNLG
jgi:thioredoxin-like negative regulator of GroEL